MILLCISYLFSNFSAIKHINDYNYYYFNYEKSSDGRSCLNLHDDDKCSIYLLW